MTMKVFMGFVVLMAAGLSGTASAQPPDGLRLVQQNILADLRDKRRVYLVAISPPVSVVDTQQVQDEAAYARAVIAEVAHLDATKKKREAFKELAGPLKKYAKRYKSLELVERPEDADFLLIFYETARRKFGESFGGMYKLNWSFGILVVVRMGSPEKPEPSVITYSEHAVAHEVIKDFIRDLKLVRGERFSR